jgi:hypothetical protein
MTSGIRLAAVALAVAVALGGCATPATYQAMTVQAQPELAANPKLKGAIRLDTVTGGKDTNPLWTSQVDSAGFAKALEGSLASAGYLAPAGSTAPYALSAELKTLDQPLFGFAMSVSSTVLYKLSGSGAAKEYPVTAAGSASVSDAFVAIERLRLASERSILENIKMLLRELQAF